MLLSVPIKSVHVKDVLVPNEVLLRPPPPMASSLSATSTSTSTSSHCPLPLSSGNASANQKDPINHDNTNNDDTRGNGGTTTQSSSPTTVTALLHIWDHLTLSQRNMLEDTHGFLFTTVSEVISLPIKCTAFSSPDASTNRRETAANEEEEEENSKSNDSHNNNSNSHMSNRFVGDHEQKRRNGFEEKERGKKVRKTVAAATTTDVPSSSSVASGLFSALKKPFKLFFAQRDDDVNEEIDEDEEEEGEEIFAVLSPYAQDDRRDNNYVREEQSLLITPPLASVRGGGGGGIKKDSFFRTHRHSSATATSTSFLRRPSSPLSATFPIPLTPLAQCSSTERYYGRRQQAAAHPLSPAFVGDISTPSRWLAHTKKQEGSFLPHLSELKGKDCQVEVVERRRLHCLVIPEGYFVTFDAELCATATTTTTATSRRAASTTDSSTTTGTFLTNHSARGKEEEETNTLSLTAALTEDAHACSSTSSPLPPSHATVCVDADDCVFGTVTIRRIRRNSYFMKMNGGGRGGGRAGDASQRPRPDLESLHWLNVLGLSRKEEEEEADADKGGDTNNSNNNERCCEVVLRFELTCHVREVFQLYNEDNNDNDKGTAANGRANAHGHTNDVGARGDSASAGRGTANNNSKAIVRFPLYFKDITRMDIEKVTEKRSESEGKDDGEYNDNSVSSSRGKEGGDIDARRGSSTANYSDEVEELLFGDGKMSNKDENNAKKKHSFYSSEEEITRRYNAIVAAFSAFSLSRSSSLAPSSSSSSLMISCGLTRLGPLSVPIRSELFDRPFSSPALSKYIAPPHAVKAAFKDWSREQQDGLKLREKEARRRGVAKEKKRQQKKKVKRKMDRTNTEDDTSDGSPSVSAEGGGHLCEEDAERCEEYTDSEEKEEVLVDAGQLYDYEVSAAFYALRKEASARWRTLATVHIELVANTSLLMAPSQNPEKDEDNNSKTTMPGDTMSNAINEGNEEKRHQPIPTSSSPPSTSSLGIGSNPFATLFYSLASTFSRRDGGMGSGAPSPAIDFVRVAMTKAGDACAPSDHNVRVNRRTFVYVLTNSVASMRMCLNSHQHEHLHLGGDDRLNLPSISTSAAQEASSSSSFPTFLSLFPLLMAHSRRGDTQRGRLRREGRGVVLSSSVGGGGEEERAGREHEYRSPTMRSVTNGPASEFGAMLRCDHYCDESEEKKSLSSSSSSSSRDRGGGGNTLSLSGDKNETDNAGEKGEDEASEAQASAKREDLGMRNTLNTCAIGGDYEEGDDTATTSNSMGTGHEASQHSYENGKERRSYESCYSAEDQPKRQEENERQETDGLLFSPKNSPMSSPSLPPPAAEKNNEKPSAPTLSARNTTAENNHDRQSGTADDGTNWKEGGTVEPNNAASTGTTADGHGGDDDENIIFDFDFSSSRQNNHNDQKALSSAAAEAEEEGGMHQRITATYPLQEASLSKNSCFSQQSLTFTFVRAGACSRAHSASSEEEEMKGSHAHKEMKGSGKHRNDEEQQCLLLPNVNVNGNNDTGTTNGTSTEVTEEENFFCRPPNDTWAFERAKLQIFHNEEVESSFCFDVEAGAATRENNTEPNAIKTTFLPFLGPATEGTEGDGAQVIKVSSNTINTHHSNFCQYAHNTYSTYNDAKDCCNENVNVNHDADEEDHDLAAAAGDGDAAEEAMWWPPLDNRDTDGARPESLTAATPSKAPKSLFLSEGGPEFLDPPTVAKPIYLITTTTAVGWQDSHNACRHTNDDDDDVLSTPPAKAKKVSEQLVATTSSPPFHVPVHVNFDDVGRDDDADVPAAVPIAHNNTITTKGSASPLALGSEDRDAEEKLIAQQTSYFPFSSPKPPPPPQLLLTIPKEDDPELVVLRECENMMILLNQNSSSPPLSLLVSPSKGPTPQPPPPLFPLRLSSASSGPSVSSADPTPCIVHNYNPTPNTSPRENKRKKKGGEGAAAAGDAAKTKSKRNNGRKRKTERAAAVGEEKDEREEEEHEAYNDYDYDRDRHVHGGEEEDAFGAGAAYSGGSSAAGRHLNNRNGVRGGQHDVANHLDHRIDDDDRPRGEMERATTNDDHGRNDHNRSIEDNKYAYSIISGIGIGRISGGGGNNDNTSTRDGNVRGCGGGPLLRVHSSIAVEDDDNNDHNTKIDKKNVLSSSYCTSLPVLNKRYLLPTTFNLDNAQTDVPIRHDDLDDLDAQDAAFGDGEPVIGAGTMVDVDAGTTDGTVRYCGDATEGAAGITVGNKAESFSHMMTLVKPPICVTGSGAGGDFCSVEKEKGNNKNHSFLSQTASDSYLHHLYQQKPHQQQTYILNTCIAAVHQKMPTTTKKAMKSTMKKTTPTTAKQTTTPTCGGQGGGDGTLQRKEEKEERATITTATAANITTTTTTTSPSIVTSTPVKAVVASDEPRSTSPPPTLDDQRHQHQHQSHNNDNDNQNAVTATLSPPSGRKNQIIQLHYLQEDDDNNNINRATPRANTANEGGSTWCVEGGGDDADYAPSPPADEEHTPMSATNEQVGHNEANILATDQATEGKAAAAEAFVDKGGREDDDDASDTERKRSIVTHALLLASEDLGRDRDEGTPTTRRRKNSRLLTQEDQLINHCRHHQPPPLPPTPPTPPSLPTPLKPSSSPLNLAEKRVPFVEFPLASASGEGLIVARRSSTHVASAHNDETKEARVSAWLAESTNTVMAACSLIKGRDAKRDEKGENKRKYDGEEEEEAFDVKGVKGLDKEVVVMSTPLEPPTSMAMAIASAAYYAKTNKNNNSNATNNNKYNTVVGSAYRATPHPCSGIRRRGHPLHHEDNVVLSPMQQASTNPRPHRSDHYLAINSVARKLNMSSPPHIDPHQLFPPHIDPPLPSLQSKGQDHLPLINPSKPSSLSRRASGLSFVVGEEKREKRPSSTIRGSFPFDEEWDATTTVTTPRRGTRTTPTRIMRASTRATAEPFPQMIAGDFAAFPEEEVLQSTDKKGKKKACGRRSATERFFGFCCSERMEEGAGKSGSGSDEDYRNLKDNQLFLREANSLTAHNLNSHYHGTPNNNNNNNNTKDGSVFLRDRDDGWSLARRARRSTTKWRGSSLLHSRRTTVGYGPRLTKVRLPDSSILDADASADATHIASLLKIDTFEFSSGRATTRAVRNTAATPTQPPSPPYIKMTRMNSFYSSALRGRGGRRTACTTVGRVDYDENDENEEWSEKRVQQDGPNGTIKGTLSAISEMVNRSANSIRKERTTDTMSHTAEHQKQNQQRGGGATPTTTLSSSAAYLAPRGFLEEINRNTCRTRTHSRTAYRENDDDIRIVYHPADAPPSPDQSNYETTTKQRSNPRYLYNNSNNSRNPRNTEGDEVERDLAPTLSPTASFSRPYSPLRKPNQFPLPPENNLGKPSFSSSSRGERAPVSQRTPTTTTATQRYFPPSPSYMYRGSQNQQQQQQQQQQEEEKEQEEQQRERKRRERSTTAPPIHRWTTQCYIDEDEDKIDRHANTKEEISVPLSARAKNRIGGAVKRSRMEEEDKEEYSKENVKRNNNNNNTIGCSMMNSRLFMAMDNDTVNNESERRRYNGRGGGEGGFLWNTAEEMPRTIVKGLRYEEGEDGDKSEKRRRIRRTSISRGRGKEGSKRDSERDEGRGEIVRRELYKRMVGEKDDSSSICHSSRPSWGLSPAEKITDELMAFLRRQAEKMSARTRSNVVKTGGCGQAQSHGHSDVKVRGDVRDLQRFPSLSYLRSEGEQEQLWSGDSRLPSLDVGGEEGEGGYSVANKPFYPSSKYSGGVGGNNSNSMCQALPLLSSSSPASPPNALCRMSAVNALNERLNHKNVAVAHGSSTNGVSRPPFKVGAHLSRPTSPSHPPVPPSQHQQAPGAAAMPFTTVGTMPYLPPPPPSDSSPHFFQNPSQQHYVHNYQQSQQQQQQCYLPGASGGGEEEGHRGHAVFAPPLTSAGRHNRTRLGEFADESEKDRPPPLPPTDDEMGGGMGTIGNYCTGNNNNNNNSYCSREQCCLSASSSRPTPSHWAHEISSTATPRSNGATTPRQHAHLLYHQVQSFPQVHHQQQNQYQPQHHQGQSQQQALSSPSFAPPPLHTCHAHNHHRPHCDPNPAKSHPCSSPSLHSFAHQPAFSTVPMPTTHSAPYPCCNTIIDVGSTIKHCAAAAAAASPLCSSPSHHFCCGFPPASAAAWGRSSVGEGLSSSPPLSSTSPASPSNTFSPFVGAAHHTSPSGPSSTWPHLMPHAYVCTSTASSASSPYCGSHFAAADMEHHQHHHCLAPPY